MKKRTSIAIDPELTKRINKALENSNMKLAEFARKALDKQLIINEAEQIEQRLKKLGTAGQYQRIKRLEDDIAKLKNETFAKKDVEQMMMRLTDRIRKDIEYIKKEQDEFDRKYKKKKLKKK